MRKSDRELGMHCAITRRDFIHDVGLAGLGLSLAPTAWATQGAPERYYPPTRTGLRGSHPGSFEIAHALAREGKAFDKPTDLDEAWDLVVVGGGISGLAAAWFWRKQRGPEARILVLDNHDDFGGHAKRNEFHLDGQMRLAWGGTVNMEYPRFSKVAMGLVENLGISIPRLLEGFEYSWQGDMHGLRGGTWFSARDFGRDVFIPNLSLDDRPPADLIAYVDDIPVSPSSRASLRAFLEAPRDVLQGLSDADRQAYLHGTPYTQFLREKCGLTEEAVGLFLDVTFGYWGVPADNLSVAECLDSGMPGLHAIGGDYHEIDEETGPGGGSAYFPDGNSSIARLLVRALVPGSVPGLPPGSDAHDIVTAELDYSALDRPGAPACVRLNATAVHAENTDSGVAVTYVKDGQVLRVRAARAIMACYNNIIPHLCPSMPQAQKSALAQCIKRPMLIINVLLRDGHAIRRSGIAGAALSKRLCQNMRLVTGINVGQYRPAWRPGDPCVMQFYGGVAAPAPEGMTLVDRHRAARAHLLGMSFEDFEREVREVLDGIYGEFGFDAARGITAIMVNRWPHGYARDHVDLEDPAWNTDPPPNVVGRAPFGNIAIANSDAGADAFTHTAIDQAWRAVNELTG